MRREKADLALGLCAVILALLAILVWAPNDIATGVIVKQRGRVSIGDAMAPIFAFGLIALAGALIMFEKRTKAGAPHLTRENLRFMAIFAGVFLLAMILMRWSGPALVALGQGFGVTESDYRELRDTAPWKYTGFVLGGAGLVAMLIALMERRWSWRAAFIGLLAAAALIAVFDLPFSNLLLPPNGDV